MATLWKHEDMPFTASGMVPDILFNPHGFPSRMTIGMLIESIAGKAAALSGTREANSTAFRKYRGHFTDPDNNEDDIFLENDVPTSMDPAKMPTAADYFGKTLRDYGYAYYGTEELYDGIHGKPKQSHIFMGVIYYQRLRHMVSDKAQVRATGPLDPLTRQPVKGRQRHGGIRLGEMERDALIAHGGSYLVKDRLMRCSDYSIAHVCPECGSLVTPKPKREQTTFAGGFNSAKYREDQAGATSMEQVCYCLGDCKPTVCHEVQVPFTWRLLTVEMAALGINLKLSLNKANPCPNIVSEFLENVDNDLLIDANGDDDDEEEGLDVSEDEGMILMGGESSSDDDEDEEDLSH